MNTTKKIALACLALAFIAGMAFLPTQAKAETFENATVTMLNSAPEWDSKIQLSYQKELLSPENDTNVYGYAKFTLPTSGLLQTKTFTEEVGSDVYLSSDCKVEIFSDAGCSNLKLDCGISSTKHVQLGAGTYYLRVKACKIMFWKCHYIQKVNLGLIPDSKLLTLSQKVNAKNAVISVANGLGGENFPVYDTEYQSGRISVANASSNKFWKTSFLGEYSSSNKAVKTVRGNKFVVTENGWYTVRIQTTHSDYAYSNSILVTNLKPTVKGIVNNKTYKRKAVVKFYDRGKGIKKATLNGKKVKSGKKVTKKGKYTLKVTNKANKTITVKFKVK